MWIVNAILSSFSNSTFVHRSKITVLLSPRPSICFMWFSRRSFFYGLAALYPATLKGCSTVFRAGCKQFPTLRKYKQSSCRGWHYQKRQSACPPHTAENLSPQNFSGIGGENQLDRYCGGVPVVNGMGVRMGIPNKVPYIVMSQLSLLPLNFLSGIE